ncbi:MAG: hypothetical protein F4221_05005 [Rhodothermaceae bacterium]|nr:hypothetical protein [Rhodothermaceae bacterium]
MNDSPNITGIEGRLAIALRQFLALPGIEKRFERSQFSAQFDRPQFSIQFERISKDMAYREREWLTAVPSLQNLRDWIDTQWDTARQSLPPAGTVSTVDKWGDQSEVQIDSMTAACKLLLAAALYGSETVGKYAMEFSVHGMIEVRSFFLLRGLSVLNAKPLDDYCTLTPYGGVLEKVKAITAARHLAEDLYWPPESAADICVLEVRSFERRGSAVDDVERRVSRLLLCGPETLTLILGLVWGSGIHIFRSLRYVASPVAATLPFFRTMSIGGMYVNQTLIPFPGFKPPSPSRRPVNEVELMELTSKYADLSDQERRMLNLAMRRLRDSTKRTELEDKVVDLSIALEALFSGGRKNIRETVSCRGSWYFSDSLLERMEVSKLLKKFYDDRSYIVHGNISKRLAKKRKREQNRRVLLAKVDNVVRTSLKAMISQGIPQDWEDSSDQGAIRFDPPRAATEIPSVKSDSLSWTVAEQEKIDQALEAIWRPTIDNAPAPSPNAGSLCYPAVNRAQIQKLKRQGVCYIIIAPALLYMAHPKWLERAMEPLDDQTRYYCERDVDKHLQKWRKAVGNKKVFVFDLPLEDASKYLPKYFDYWRKLVSGESVANALNPQVRNA